MRTSWLIAAALAWPLITFAAPTKVDLSRSGRNDTAAPHFLEWQVDPAQPSLRLDGLRVLLRGSEGEGGSLEGGLYKGYTNLERYLNFLAGDD